MGSTVSIDKVLSPGIPSAKAFKLFCDASACYAIFLARDWGGYGGVGGGISVPGKVFTATVGAVSHNKIAGKLQKLRDATPEDLVKKDKRSVKIAYDEIVEFRHKEKSIWFGHPNILFKTKNGKWRFTFADESAYKEVVSFILDKRPDLV